jgi:uncharacterized damage-inducible protein DinB
MPEAWLRGNVPGVPVLLMPAAHAIIDAGEELERACAGLSVEQLWARPGGAASIGFHLRHVVGSLDRLLTYARGNALSQAQLDALRQEGEPGDPPETLDSLMTGVRTAVADTLDAYRSMPDDTLHDARKVGRAGLPSTVFGLLFHAAEHARRHAGQVIATASILKGGSWTGTAGEGGPPEGDGEAG